MRSSRSALLTLAVIVFCYGRALTAEDSPGPRYGHEMVYDEASWSESAGWRIVAGSPKPLGYGARRAASIDPALTLRHD